MKSQLVTKGIRTKLKKAMEAKPVLAAVAYVSNVDSLPLGAGDIVVCDASKHAAAAGSTRKEALLALVKNKVTVWSLEGLHAKVVVAGKNAFIGSANWSNNADNRLQEAVLQTDDPAVAGAAKAFIKDLIAARADAVDRAYIKSLPDPPSPDGRSEGGKFGGTTRHWLISLAPLSDRLERKAGPVLNAHAEKLSELLEGEAKIYWFRLTPAVSKSSRVRAGDWMTASWREGDATPTVWPPRLVVGRGVFGGHHGIFFRHEPGDDALAVSWKKFHSQAVKSGMRPGIRDNKDYEITASQAQLLSAWWEARQKKDAAEASPAET